MRGLLVAVAATTLVVSTTAVTMADPTELGTPFTGTLSFGACATERPDSDAPRVVEPFTDHRLDGSVSITGWSSGYPSACVWFGSWLIGESADGWVELASPRMQSRDGTPTQYTSLLVGTGTNEGLFALSQVTVTGSAFDFDGRIIRGDIDQVVDYSGVLLPGDLAELGW